MTSKKPRLGRGLDALLGAAAPAAPQLAEEATPVTGEQLRTLPVDLIQRGKYQPRSHMDQDSLEELAASIQAQGVIQPIVVRPVGGGRYEIIAGERRWRATQLAGLHEIPAVVREVPDQAAIAMALIENIQRENLNPLEEATALQRLLDEFGLTHQEAADAVGRSRAAVSNLLRLLDLNEDVKRLVDQGELEMGHARALLALRGAQQSEAARQVVAKALSARATERLVRHLLEPKAAPARARPDADIARAQEDLGQRLGAKVEIRHGARGKGTIVIHYNSVEEFEGIVAHVR